MTPGNIMRSRLRTFAVLLAVVAAGYLFGVAEEHDHGHAGDVAHAQTGGEGETTLAPDFTLPSLSGGNVSLRDYRGKWVFVNFWATWCGPCVIEMPMLNKMYHTLKNDTFELLAVNTEDIDPKTVRRFVEELKLDFPILLDRQSTTLRPYAVRSLPMTYMIAPDGTVEAKAEGMREWDSAEMVQYLRDLMDGKLDDKPATAGTQTKS